METGVRIYNVEPLMEKGHLGLFHLLPYQSHYYYYLDSFLEMLFFIFEDIRLQG